MSQTQTGDAYRLPIDVGMTEPGGKVRVERVDLAGRTGRFTLKAEAEPRALTLDPNTWVLMQAGPLRGREISPAVQQP